jgi:hypothetical protein
MDIIKDPLFEEKINENNKDQILDAIKLLKENETQLRAIRQNLQSQYFYYVNKNHLCSIISGKTRAG